MITQLEKNSALATGHTLTTNALIENLNSILLQIDGTAILAAAANMSLSVRSGNISLLSMPVSHLVRAANLLSGTPGSANEVLLEVKFGVLRLQRELVIELVNESGIALTVDVVIVHNEPMVAPGFVWRYYTDSSFAIVQADLILAFATDLDEHAGTITVGGEQISLSASFIIANARYKLEATVKTVGVIRDSTPISAAILVFDAAGNAVTIVTREMIQSVTMESWYHFAGPIALEQARIVRRIPRAPVRTVRRVGS